MTRTPLTTEGIIEAAARVADEVGLNGVSMRSVGRELGVEAMSLYHHIANKDALLDKMTDWIFTTITNPVVGEPWRPAMETRAHSARLVLRAHPWGLGLIESRRSPGPATLEHHNSVLGCLRTAGFSVELAAHAFSVLDAYVFGFVLTEVNLPFEDSESITEFIANLGDLAEQFPHLAEMIEVQVSGRDYQYGNEFQHGLALILDGLAAEFSSPR